MHVHALIDTLETGGAENLLLDFVAGAKPRGIEVTVGYLNAANPVGLDSLRALGVEPRLTEVSSLFNVSQHRRLRDDLRAVGPDLLHTHLGTADFFGSLAARSLSIPSVSTLHAAASARPGRREQLRSRLIAWARHRGADRVIAVSEAARRHYLSYGWERPERVLTIHNGVVGSDGAGAGPGIRTALELGSDELVMATVSVLKPGKGHGIAIDVVAALRAEGLPVRLLVLGDGPLEAEIGSQLQRLGGAGVALGHRDDVAAVLDAVDVLIHPSEADAFPGALLQAMAARVPAVATDVGGISEIIVDGETGLLAPAPPSVAGFVEPVRRLLGDPDLRERMGNAGRERLEREFTVAAWLDRLLPVYEDVIAGRSPATSASSSSSTGT